MNIQEIIESGVIELYVMNALPEDEAARVEDLAVEHPEIRMEIEEVQSVLQLYSEAHAIEPNPELKDKILEKIKGQGASSYQNPLPPKTLSQVPDQPLSSRSPWTWLAAVASIIAIVLFFQNMNHKKALTDCTAENTKLVENQKVVAQLEHKLNILRSADTKPIEMKGLPIAPDSKVMVYWNAKEKATLLSIQKLPAPPKGKQYQLWAIVDKKPVDAGVFVYDLTAVQPMKIFEKANTFAVTLEPEGGSRSPTMDNMYVIADVL